MKSIVVNVLLVLFVVSRCYAQTKLVDNLKGTWLIDAQSAINPAPELAAVNTFLDNLSGTIQPVICKYDSTVMVQPTLFQNGKIITKDSEWELSTSVKSLPDNPEVMDINLRFKLRSGNAKSTGVAVAFQFKNWSAENYVHVPGSVYNGNRFRIHPVKYPPYIQEEADKPLDMPITVTNIPHLNTDLSHAKIELLTGNCTTPLMSFYNASDQRGFIVLVEQQTRFGNSALIIEEDLASKQASFVVSAPGIREQRYVMTGFEPSDDSAFDRKQGDSVDIKLRVYNFRAANLQEFFERVFTVRKDLSGKTKYRNLIPFSAVADTILLHHDKTNWYDNGKYGFLTDGDESKSWPWKNILQLGWGGAPVITYPYIISPTPERLRRVSKTLDMLCELQAPTGLIYAKWNETLLGDNHGAMKTKPEIVLVRRFGETLYYGIHNLKALKTNGYSHLIKPEWEATMRKLADGLTTLWNRYSQFGQFVDVHSGQIDVPGSSAGVVCASGLALASEYFNESSYLKTAEKAAHFYYSRDLLKGYGGGSPREILQAPDYESAHCFCDLYSILYDMTGKPEYLDYARAAMAYLATWEISYDYKFPSGSRMDLIKAGVTGAYMASSQNNHGAPCLWIHSGDFMLKLYRATGDERYAELAKNLVHNVVQYVTTQSNPLIPGACSGSVSERVQISDWEGKQDVGNGFPYGDSRLQWEVAVLITLMQNPGIYLRTDNGSMIVFDHVKAEIVKKEKHGITLKITNDTEKDAKISIFAEDSENTKRPMGNYAFLEWPKVKVRAGQSLKCFISNEGKIQH
jgi:hypothetical protein